MVLEQSTACRRSHMIKPCQGSTMQASYTTGESAASKGGQQHAPSFPRAKCGFLERSSPWGNNAETASAVCSGKTLRLTAMVSPTAKVLISLQLALRRWIHFGCGRRQRIRAMSRKLGTPLNSDYTSCFKVQSKYLRAQFITVGSSFMS